MKTLFEYCWTRIVELLLGAVSLLYGDHIDGNVLRKSSVKKPSSQSREETEMFECEWTDSPDWETDLVRLSSECPKNPGHKDFIHVEEFDLHHLPKSYRCEDVVEWVRVNGELTLRLTVSLRSPFRPHTFTDTEVGKGISGYDRLIGMPYPFSSDKHQRSGRFGTGYVFRVDLSNKYNEGNDSCPCTDCKNSHCLQLDRGRIYVKTAAHVVFDSAEGKETKGEFFYDSELSRREGRMTTVRDWRVLKSSAERDECIMYTITHDKTLLDRLQRALRRRDVLGDRLRENNRERAGIFRFIVSHPHGRSKMVSCGWNQETLKGRAFGDEQFIYTVPTCPGSSGARILRVGRWGWIGVSHSMNNGAGTGRSSCLATTYEL